MIVGLDMDGTITKHPDLFRILTKGLKAEGHSVHIITCRIEDEFTRKELSEIGILYDKLHLMPEQNLKRHTVGQWKKSVCKREGIDILFEDSGDVLIQTADIAHGFFVL